MINSRSFLQHPLVPHQSLCVFFLGGGTESVEYISVLVAEFRTIPSGISLILWMIELPACTVLLEISSSMLYSRSLKSINHVHSSPGLGVPFFYAHVIKMDAVCLCPFYYIMPEILQGIHMFCLYRLWKCKVIFYYSPWHLVTEKSPSGLVFYFRAPIPLTFGLLVGVVSSNLLGISQVGLLVFRLQELCRTTIVPCMEN